MDYPNWINVCVRSADIQSLSEILTVLALRRIWSIIDLITGWPATILWQLVMVRHECIMAVVWISWIWSPNGYFSACKTVWHVWFAVSANVTNTSQICFVDFTGCRLEAALPLKWPHLVSECISTVSLATWTLCCSHMCWSTHCTRQTKDYL